MKIHNIKITNFKSLYGEHYFDFDDLTGLVKLSGPIGAGKTSLGEAICVALFGKVHDKSNYNLVAWGTDTFELEINITSKNRDINIVRNPKKQLEVHIDGKLLAATGKNDMQSTLEEFYDVPKMAIENLCIINFNTFNSLITMNPYNIKRFLDDVFGFRVFTEYNDEATIERKEYEKKLTELNAVYQDTVKQIADINDTKNKKNEALSQTIDIEALNKQRVSLVADGVSKKELLNSISTEMTDAVKEYDVKISDLECKRSEAVALGKIQKDNYNKFKDGKCPTCGNEISNDVIERYKQKMQSYAADIHHYDDNMSKCRTKRQDIESEYNKKISVIKGEMQQLRDEISNIDYSIRKYNDTIKLINENYDDMIASLEQKKDCINVQIIDCTKEVGEWSEMNELFTKTLRYKLLDTLVPHINATIQFYINKFEQKYKIYFDQEFKVHIFTDNVSGEISYKDLSTGQRKTVDLAVIFGIIQNIIVNTDFNVLFLDELMSNIDTDTRNIILNVLTENIKDDKTIFIINHSEMSDSFFKHKIRVHLKNKVIKLSKAKLKKAVETGDTEIVAYSSEYETIHF